MRAGARLPGEAAQTAGTVEKKEESKQRFKYRSTKGRSRSRLQRKFSDLLSRVTGRGISKTQIPEPDAKNRNEALRR